MMECLLVYLQISQTENKKNASAKLLAFTTKLLDLDKQNRYDIIQHLQMTWRDIVILVHYIQVVSVPSSENFPQTNLVCVHGM